MKLLILDNYDSFVYNLVHMVQAIDPTIEMHIVRNDKISVEQIAQYDKILLSPGPGIPQEAGIMMSLLQEYGLNKSILGVCLGHQAIAEAAGARLINLPSVFHGVATNVSIHQRDALFSGLPDAFTCGRYHSWAVDPESDLQNIEVLAQDDSGHIMAIRHRHYDWRGVQFHPESIMTQHGRELIQNWLIQ